MKFINILILLTFVLFGCKNYYIEESKKNPKKYILLNNNFVNTLKNNIQKSRKVTIEQEKEEFINRGINNPRYFEKIYLNGEKINIYNFVLIEGVDYKNELFYYGGYLSKNYIYKEIDSELIDFFHEFMLNVPYSFNNNTFFNNDVQYFTIDRISAIGINKYEVESVIVPEMLNYQKNIFEKFLGLDW